MKNEANKESEKNFNDWLESIIFVGEDGKPLFLGQVDNADSQT